MKTPISLANSDEWSPVLTKADFVRRYAAGEFGNRAPTWLTIAEYLRSGYRGLVHIRNRVAGGPTWYNVPAEDVWSTFCAAITRPDVSGDRLYFSGMAPHDHGTVQGYSCDGYNGLTLDYSTLKIPMRDALAQGQLCAAGIRALEIVRAAMDPVSFDWWQSLRRRYTGHVIEFSCFDCEWGTIPGRNTVFWEVRLY